MSLLGSTSLAPSAPTGLSVLAATQNTLTVRWQRPDSYRVRSYDVFANGALVAVTNTTSVKLTHLTCGTAYLVEVDAIDRRGRHSAKVSTSASTSACTDTTPPTTPTGLTVSAVSGNSLTLFWTASLDNLGVVGYRVYNGTTVAGSTATTSYTVLNISCGKSYTLAVDAYDAAGEPFGHDDGQRDHGRLS